MEDYLLFSRQMEVNDPSNCGGWGASEKLKHGCKRKNWHYTCPRPRELEVAASSAGQVNPFLSPPPAHGQRTGRIKY